MRKFLLIFVALLLAFAGGFLTRHFCHFSGRFSDIKEKVVEVIKYDTIRVEKPVFFETRVTDTLLVKVTEYEVVHDTAFVTLPREEVEYRDSSYRAVVSGFRPRLEELEIYQKEKIVTIQTEKVVSVPERKRWGVGVQAGYGITPAGFQPYLGVGLSFNLLRF